MEMMNGTLFKEMLESGANLLANRYAQIDALNVFPFRMVIRVRICR